MTTGFLNVNGARLWYEEAGSGHAVVFVHAGICDHRQWDTQMAPFAAKYRTVRFDMRGFGQSDLPAGPASLSDDIGGVLDALGIDRAAVIGCSMGGSAAIDFTIKRPERVSALVAVGPGLSGGPQELSPEEQTVIAEIEEADKAGDWERLNQAELRLWVDGVTRTEKVAPEVRALVAKMNMNNIRRGAEWEAVQFAPLDPPAAGRLGEIQVPTLLIVGDQDAYNVRKTVDLLAEGVAGARKIVMPGLTHVPNMERPDEFNQAVFDFLAPVW